MKNSNLLCLMIVVALLFSGLLSVTGCGQPTEAARQNRRLTDALLTAVTTKNLKELEKSKALIDKRRADAVLSEANHKTLSDIFAQAKSGKWSEAEEALYKYREAEPFPK